MKLYTEEQVKLLLGEHLSEYSVDKCLRDTEHIELPSDEEIETAASDTYRDHPNNPKEHPDWTYNKDVNAPRKRRAFNIGAHWILNQIKQQKDEKQTTGTKPTEQFVR